MLGLAGGKDSLSMLHVLLALQRKAPIRFAVAACTVDPQTPEYDPSVLKAYLAQLGAPARLGPQQPPLPPPFGRLSFVV